jgi:pimeloyl-ACP methyl ester carboxylesterase
MRLSTLLARLARASLPVALLIPTFLLTGCATTFMLHPQIARDAAANWPIYPVQNGDHPEIVTLTNVSGHRLAGWVFSSPTNHGVVLVGDGNATGIAQTYDYNRFLLHHGFNVVVLSYQGFDANGGSAALQSLSGDVETFYSFCQARFPGEPIALVGESLSAGVFFCFASRRPALACTVLEGTVDLKRVAFTKLNEMWALYPVYPFTGLTAWSISAGVPSDLSAQEALLLHPVIPTLFIHRPEDPVTPYRDARRLFEAYAGPKEFINPRIDAKKGYHMAGMFDPDLRSRIVSFLKQSLRKPI